MSRPVAVQGFCDSSIDSRSNRLTLAACFAPPDVWEEFERCWAQVLGREGSTLNYLHMRELGERSDKTLYELINECISPAALGRDEEVCLFGAFCTITGDDFERAQLDAPRLRSRSRESVCVEVVTELGLRRLLRSNEDGPVGSLEVYFDRGEPFEAELLRVWRRAMQQPADKRGPLGWVSSVRSIPMRESAGVQVADFFAWHINRWLSQGSQRANIRAVFALPSRDGRADRDRLVEWYGPDAKTMFGSTFD